MSSIPAFRDDLTCSREEQQGVVFYRIDDPQTQTSFRLYEIEYLIATKLDGNRSLDEVIAAVKDEFNFDINQADLQRFVGQLEQMGFLTGSEGAVQPQDGEGDVTVTQARAPVPDSSIELLDPIEADSSNVDQAEVDRLLRAAFLYVKQGYIVHARDYFLAAKELDRADSRFDTLVNHLEIIGDSSGPAEVEYLWAEAAKLFPEMAEEIGPPDSKSTDPISDPRSTGRQEAPRDEDLRSRLMWLGLAVAVFVVGGGALAWVAFKARLFESPALVQVASVEHKAFDVYYKGRAVNRAPAADVWAPAKQAGTIAEVRVKVGAVVNEGDIVAMLELGGRAGKPYRQAVEGMRKAQAQYDKAASKLEKLLRQRERVEQDRAKADEKLKALRPKTILPKGKAKREAAKWRKKRVQANKKLTQLAKKERGPRSQLKKAQAKLKQARAKVAGLEKGLGPLLVRAPVGGTVKEVNVRPGAGVDAGAGVLRIVDESTFLLTFEIQEQIPFQRGGEASVVVDEEGPISCRVDSIKPGDQSYTVSFRVPDDGARVADVALAEARLMRGQVERAVRLPQAAVADDEKGARIFVVNDDHVDELAVQVLGHDGDLIIIKDVSERLRDGQEVVVERLDGEPLGALLDGAAIEVSS